MDTLYFNDEQLMVRNMVQEFSESEIRPIAQELDEKGKFPKEIVSKMGELGLM